ncbi:hypothetical protein TNO010_400033 [Tenacibaculum finnmarkense genomovar ulcerans]|uniref:Uncharacterized protein n=2 Tax=Tenacibaculum finnmarkense TaxID=2781243 RepID=A0A2I2MA81_9FLAO|nr:hypothetical protein TNO010_400033 [Tenacibaculum finnmarkense genomovar ulcerans]
MRLQLQKELNISQANRSSKYITAGIKRKADRYLQEILENLETPPPPSKKALTLKEYIELVKKNKLCTPNNR